MPNVINVYVTADGSGNSFIYADSLVPLDKATLNDLYSKAINGDVVAVSAANVKYIKMDNSPMGDWDVQPLNLVS